MIRKELKDITNQQINNSDNQIQARCKTVKLKPTDRMNQKKTIKNQTNTSQNDYYYLSYYINDIYSYLLEREQIFHSKRQESNLLSSKRIKILSWLYYLSNCMKIPNDTIYLTIALIDSPTNDIFDDCKSDLRIIGITKLMIASKVEDCIPIKLKHVFHFSGIDDDENIQKHYKDTELKVLNELDFNVNIPTPFSFLKHFMKIRTINNEVFQFCKLIIDIMLFIDKFRKHPYHLIAATSFCCSLDLLLNMNLGDNWTNSLINNSKITKYQLIPLIKEFYNELIDQIENDFLTMLFNQYRSILDPDILSLTNIKKMLSNSE